MFVILVKMQQEEITKAADLAALRAQSVAVDLIRNPDLETVSDTHDGEVQETILLLRETVFLVSTKLVN